MLLDVTQRERWVWCIPMARTGGEHGVLLAEYELAQRRRNYARGTTRKRVATARRWLEHIGDQWSAATWRDIDLFGDTRLIAPTTWRDEVSHLSTFYRWAMRADLCLSDPTALVERPRVPQRQPRPATEMEYIRVLSGSAPTMRAILELMGRSGLRCCEVARLRWADVDLVGRAARVHGKGDRDRTVGLPRRVVQALAAIDGDAELVFISPTTGVGYKAHRISSLVSQWCHGQGVPVTAHQLRHRYATVLLDAADGDLKVVQEALGHVSVATTEIYAKLNRRRAVAAAVRMDRFDDTDDTLF